MIKSEFTFGYVRVASCVPGISVCDVKSNLEAIKELISEAARHSVDVAVFPELCLTGYTCQDMFHQSSLLEEVDNALSEIKSHLRIKENRNLTVIVGAPYMDNGKLKNGAYVIQWDKPRKVVGKRNLPNYKEFYEKRWFAEDDEELQIFVHSKFKFGIEICEDVWAPEPPSTKLVKAGAEVIFNLSASNELVGKNDYLMRLLQQQSERLICGYVYSSAGWGESTQDLVFPGKAYIYENGKLLGGQKSFGVTDGDMIIRDIDLEALRHERVVNTTFSKFFNPGVGVKEVNVDVDICRMMISPGKDLRREVNALPFNASDKRCQEIFDIQVLALAKRIYHTGLKPVLGISGGSDSTWAAIIAYEAIAELEWDDPVSGINVLGVTMPGFATSERTYKNSIELMKALFMDSKDIDIKDICSAELEALGHSKEVQDITYENVQARTRTQILMNLANQEGGFVVGTGDMSELALGWCTYNADHMSMYGVNAGVPKTLIKRLIKWYAENKTNDNEELKKCLLDILDTPVSPELTGTGATGKAAQVTEDKIGPYELHDFFLYNFLRHGYSPTKILFLAQHAEGFSKDYDLGELKRWLKVFLKRFFSQQFKRSCLPDGPKIGSISLSPRGDLRMPTDAVVDLWLKEIEGYNGI